MVVTFTLSILMFLMWQAWVSGRNGLSDIYARSSLEYLQDKTAANFRIGEAEWQVVHDNLSRASELMPRNPRYLENLGWLEQLKVGLLADALDIDQVDAHVRAAKNNFRDAVAARPTWPYHWGSLAQYEYRRGNYDSDEYSAALVNAARFGPWKNEIQLLVADLGSDTLEFLSSSTQEEFFRNLERGFSRQSDAMTAIVSDWHYVCEVAQVPNDSLPLLSSHCETVNDQFLP